MGIIESRVGASKHAYDGDLSGPVHWCTRRGRPVRSFSDPQLISRIPATGSWVVGWQSAW